MPSGEPVAHSVAALRQGLLLDYRLVAGEGDFRMAASSGIVFAEALLGRDGRVCAQPGAWYPRRCSRLTGWRRPCGRRESMSRRPVTIGWAQPPSADQERSMFTSCSVPPASRPDRRAWSPTLRGSGRQSTPQTAATACANCPCLLIPHVPGGYGKCDGLRPPRWIGAVGQEGVD